MTGTVFSEHADKASLFWQAFKERLGDSDFHCMYFNMANFLSSDANLHFLEVPVSTREIDNVVKNMPSNKSPSPGSFNTDFFRKCLPIIKQDFYLLCSSFHRMELWLSSIDGYYITLIPKKENAIKVLGGHP
jgi:hypothetical protein